MLRHPPGSTPNDTLLPYTTLVRSNSLLKAGLSEPMAACMAGRMVDRLSLAQLRRLSSLSSIKERTMQDMTIDEFIYRIRALHDPEILEVVASSDRKSTRLNSSH